MNPIRFALRHPITMMVALVALLGAGGLALWRMKVDIFPALNLPVVYVCQPYGGMDPQQMEGLIANFYEYHFLYIGGIHHVESRNVQGVSLMKLYFHPGTDMAQAMAETVGHVNRSRAFMPPGTVPPFIMRFDTGSVPVGYLVLSSETKSVGEIQDQALFKVRPMFAARTLRAEVERANADLKLRPGMYAHARLTVALPEAWVLPAGAVVKQGDGLAAFLVQGGKAVRVGVQVGHNDGKWVEVVRIQPPGSALWQEPSGREKVASPAAGLTDGATVAAKGPDRP